MVAPHRLLILLAVVSCIGAILAKYWLSGLWVIGTPSAWLRFTNTLLFFAIALMLKQMVTLAQAKKEE